MAKCAICTTNGNDTNLGIIDGVPICVKCFSNHWNFELMDKDTYAIYMAISYATSSSAGSIDVDTTVYPGSIVLTIYNDIVAAGMVWSWLTINNYDCVVVDIAVEKAVICFHKEVK